MKVFTGMLGFVTKVGFVMKVFTGMLGFVTKEGVYPALVLGLEVFAGICHLLWVVLLSGSCGWFF